MSERSKAKAPSEMLRYLADSLEHVLPEDEYRRLLSHDADIAKTTSRGDFHRCLRCAAWAVELSTRSQRSQLRHVVSELEAVLHEIGNTNWAVEFGVWTPGRIITDVELTWVDDAVKVAQAVASDSGWASVPWERLLEELIAIEPSPA